MYFCTSFFLHAVSERRFFAAELRSDRFCTFSRFGAAALVPLLVVPLLVVLLLLDLLGAAEEVWRSLEFENDAVS